MQRIMGRKFKDCGIWQLWIPSSVTCILECALSCPNLDYVAIHEVEALEISNTTKKGTLWPDSLECINIPLQALFVKREYIMDRFLSNDVNCSLVKGERLSLPLPCGIVTVIAPAYLFGVFDLMLKQVRISPLGMGREDRSSAQHVGKAGPAGCARGGDDAAFTGILEDRHQRHKEGAQQGGR